MISKIRLKNFQSHKETELEFTEGVNTIIGTSDSGKSSIIRAINLVANNQPGGDAFVSDFVRNKKGNPKENAEVELTVDGSSVLRVKGKDNEYHVNGNELKAFGRGSIPDDVNEAINLNELNLQEQSDNFFLFGKTSGEVVRRLNSYVNLDLIDTTLANADRELRRVNTKIKETENTQKSLSTELENYAILDDLESLYTACVEEEENTNAIRDKIKRLESVIEAYQIIEEELKSFDKVNDCLTLISDTTALNRRYMDLKEDYDKLHNIIGIADSITNELVSYDTIIAMDKDVNVALKLAEEVKAASDNIEGLTNTVDNVEHTSNLLNKTSAIADIVIETDYFDIKKEFEGLYKLLDNLVECKQEVRKFTREVRRLEREYKELTPDVCPLCGKSNCED